MKKRNNRFLAGTLAGLMMLTMLPVTALAAEESAGSEITTLTTEDGGVVSGIPNNIVNVVSDGEDGQQAVDTGANNEENSGVEDVQIPADDSENSDVDTDENAAAPLDGESGGSGSSSEPATVPAAEPFVAKIGNQPYETLDEAIGAAQSGDTIEVGKDITVGAVGLTINGKGSLTIKSAEGTEATITLNGLGMYFNETNVTFQNIKIVEDGVIDNPLHSGATANLFDDSILTFDNSVLVLNGPNDGTGGHGMYVYQSSDMYVTNDSQVIISGFDHSGSSGIYIDDSENDSAGETIHNKIEVTNSSVIKITDCSWNGMTVNPTDVKIDGHSTIDISDCGKNGGRGGFGCYYGSVEISDYSSLITDNNVGRSWGAFIRDVSVDSTSSLSACGNTAYGLEIGDKLGNESKFATGSTVTLNKNGKAGLLVYTGSGYWYGNVTIEEGANFTASGNTNGIEIAPEGILDMQDGTVTLNHSNSYGGGLYNRGGTAKIGGKAEIYNNHADTAGDDIYSNSFNKNKVTYKSSLTFAPVGDGWILDDCKEEHPIVGWYHDGKEKLTDDTYKRWNGDGENEEYYADEYEVKAESVSDALALKAAHGKFHTVTYEVTGDVPSDAGDPPAAAKVKKGGDYTVAPAQTTSQSRYTFSGWRINGVGDVVTEIKNIQQDVKLIGVWTRRSSGGGGGGSKPTVDIPDDVPTGLNGDDHFAYIVGYPNGNVEPNGNITRAEVATIFFRLLTEDVRTANATQSNRLSDVSRGQWFNHAISTLSSMGIVKGHNDGTFAPNAPITRAEFAAIAARFDDKDTNTSSNFTDIASHWAKNEIGIAANKGWINGYPDGTFRPNQYITRAEAMTLVNRVLNRLPENSSDLLNTMIKWPDNSDTSAWYYLAVQEATNSHEYTDKSKDDKYEKWTTIRDARDWTELEK